MTRSEAVLAGSAGFLSAVMRPLAARLGTRPRVADNPHQAFALCQDSASLLVFEYLGREWLPLCENLRRAAGGGLSILVAVPREHAGARSALVGAGVDAAVAWDGQPEAVLDAAQRLLDGTPAHAPSGSPGPALTPVPVPQAAPRGGPTLTPRPFLAVAPREVPISPTLTPTLFPALGPRDARASPTLTPFPAVPRDAASSPTLTPRPFPAAAPPDARASPTLTPRPFPAVPRDAASSPTLTPRPFPAAAPPEAPGTAAAPPIAQPALTPTKAQPVVMPTPAEGPNAPGPSLTPGPTPALAQGATPPAGSAGAQAPPAAAALGPAAFETSDTWPGTVVAAAAAEGILTGALAGLWPEPALVPVAERMVATLTDLEKDALRGAALLVDAEPLCRAAGLRFQISAALASVPPKGRPVDGAAVRAILGGVDAVLGDVKRAAEGAVPRLQGELECIRSTLLKEAVDLTEAVREVAAPAAPVEATAEKVEARPAARAKFAARVLSNRRATEAEELAPVRRGWLWLLVLSALAAGGFHARRLLTAQLPQVPLTLPGAPAHSVGSSQGNTLLIRPPGKALDSVEFERFRSQEASKGNEIREIAPGTYLVEPRGQPSAAPAKGAAP